MGCAHGQLFSTVMNPITPLSPCARLVSCTLTVLNMHVSVSTGELHSKHDVSIIGDIMNLTLKKKKKSSPFESIITSDIQEHAGGRSVPAGVCTRVKLTFLTDECISCVFLTISACICLFARAFTVYAHIWVNLCLLICVY